MTGVIHLTSLGSALNYLFHSRVIDGFDTLDDLEKVPVEDKTFRPTTEICIRRVTIHANPIAEMQ